MLAPGTKVRVKNDWPETRGPCHIRTPHYLRGEPGVIVRHLGNFPNPDDIAFKRPPAIFPLYHVRFEQNTLWHQGQAGDEIVVEIYEPWLEAA
jgi:nitrile hydratase